jgi:putative glutamine amidotransferase
VGDPGRVLPTIGVSASFIAADPTRALFGGKPLAYLEHALAHWVMSGGALPVLVPEPRSFTHTHGIDAAAYAEALDGLLLAGGSDVWPGHYGEAALRPEWEGERARDEYERALLEAFLAKGKPVLGVCRGLQLINVALGGSLHQDIPTCVEGAARHRDQASYDRNEHGVIVEGAWLSGVLGATEGRVNSVHHQAIARLAPGLEVEARSSEDGLIEAIRSPEHRFLVGVQWHPEWRVEGDETIDPSPLLAAFLEAAQRRSRQFRDGPA